MSDEETKLLAGQMGHDLNIHLNHYAQQLGILERTKVAKIVCAFSNGLLSKQDLEIDFNTISIKDEAVVNKNGN